MKEKIKDHYENRKARMLKRLPPKDVMDYINNKVEQTYQLNNGNINKESFRLGMLCMWGYVHDNKLPNRITER